MQSGYVKPWGLSQVLVWIVTRDAAVAQQYANTDIGECNTALQLRANIDGYASTKDAGDAWTEDLAPALDNGSLTATASRVRVGRDHRHPTPGELFPPKDWPYAASTHYLDHSNTKGRVSLRPNGSQIAHEWIEWANVTFSPNDVLRLWPPVAPETAGDLAVDRMNATERESALAGILSEPRTAISIVVDVVAFGRGLTPDEMGIEIAARRSSAALRLFEAARHERLALFGRLAGGPSQPIRSDVFDTPHALVSGVRDAIEPDLGRLHMPDYADERGTQRRRWLDVRVSSLSLASWLRSQGVEAPPIAVETSQPEAQYRPMSDEEVRAFIRAKEKETGKRPKTRSWAEWPEMKARGVTKPRFESIWREVYPNAPRGRPPKQRSD